MIRRIFYFLLVTVLLGGLAGGIAFWSFYSLPAIIAKHQECAAPAADGLGRRGPSTDTWQPQIAGIGTLTAFEGSTSRRRSAAW